MKLRRVFGLVLALALAIGAVTAGPVAAYADDAATEAPQLVASTLKVSRRSAKVGQKVTFSVTITGNLNRKPELWVIPKNKAFLQWDPQKVKLERVGTSSTYRGALTVKKKMLAGTWQVSNINMFYWQVDPESGARESQAIGFYNTKNVRGTWDADEKGNLAKGDFKVVGTKADSASPELGATSINKKTVPVGTSWPKLQVTFKDASKIEFASLYFVVGGKTYNCGLDRIKLNSKTFIMTQDGGIGVEEDIEAPMVKGKHKIKAIMVEDVHHNRTLIVDKRYKKKVRKIRATGGSWHETDLYQNCYRYILAGLPDGSNFCVASSKREIVYANLSSLDFTVV